ncbi:hypothetical protein CTEN210_18181 [Chaetoceros tenuissimus]|uniref:Helicase-associated domain-containing protein n=1 Tax=Chaetoceros tenuissimus TaxID=426638 RepID=A0AAD3DEU5_9STRA|nr:hypothetical protein CTEN210_18181 [Chaetoceros tenuissimus]
MNETTEFINEASVHELLEDLKINKDQFLASSVAGRFGDNFYYSLKWLDKLEELYEYKKQYKHCNVPAKYENQTLYKWVQMQRSHYKISKISEERKQMLNAIGFNWTAVSPKEIGTMTRVFTPARRAKWDGKFQELYEHKSKHGHCNVPTKKYGGDTNHSPSTFQLGNWVRYQRTQYSLMLKGLANNLTKDQIQQLDSIGFNQKSQTKTDANNLSENKKWHDQFDLLKQCKKEHGHCDVHASYAPNESLKNWVQMQRTQYSYMVNGFTTKLTKKRCDLLESIGFNWSSKGKNQTVKQIEESKINANADERMPIEASDNVSQQKTTGKRKMEPRKSTCAKNEKPKLFRQMANEESCKESLTNASKKRKVELSGSTSLQGKDETLCKLSLLFQKEKDALYADIRKRNLANSIS